MSGPLPPGSTIGILGGGQLGRMLALAAAPLGLKVAVFAPEAGAPAFDVCAHRFEADWSDLGALDAFAAVCDIVTLEFENVPVDVLEHLAVRVPVRPGARSLALTQDRLVEKRFVAGLGLAPAPFVEVSSLTDLMVGLERLGTPAILKTRRLGYDGHGQVRIGDTAQAPLAWETVRGAPCVLEGLVGFASETSVVMARAADGTTAMWASPQNEHENGILRRSTVPGPLDSEQEAQARAAAQLIAEGLDHVGVLAVEFFVTASGLVVNEIAPRVHNSGHWTLGGARTDQFEQHVRAVAGWPLGDCSLVGEGAVMENLLGEEVGAWPSIAAEPGARLHLYGKSEARPARKMGHVTRVITRSQSRS
jgi:5-(carboxyamino)imidazole ribonucleotide synthase